MTEDYLHSKSYFTDGYWTNSSFPYFTLASLIFSLSYERMFLVEKENRTFTVEAECRKYLVEQEDRTIHVTKQ